MQEIVVALVALAAAGFVVRRIVAAVKPPAGQEGCPSCASGSTACADKAAAAANAAPAEPKPLVFIRRRT